ncbi:MAG: hypothetical protein EBY83_02485, partial [Verrucomicrobia bacterium]|nr:hypothetical protein [Verrucomicrobiota bacterium]
AELARLGYATTVFEKDAEPGGLNRYGIAYYKMPPAVAQQEVKWVKDLGVEFRTNTEIGKDVPMEKLLEDYDAVFLGMGLGRTHSLDSYEAVARSSSGRTCGGVGLWKYGD